MKIPIGVALVLVVLWAAAPAAAEPAAPQTAVKAADDVTPANGEAPVLDKIIVKPKNLKTNALNKVRIIIKYKDGDKNLQGGMLELTLAESNGYARKFSIPLTDSKFGNTKGRGTIISNFIIGNCNWANFSGKLKDALGNNSNEKEMKRNASGAGGPVWGTRLGQRAKDFTLVDQNGNSVSLHDYWGKVILLDFGNRT
jgi:hypothetical protein